MKKSSLIRQFRNSLHIVIGFILVYWLINKTDFIDYPLWQKVLGGWVGGLIGCIIGAIWEFFNLVTFQIKPSDSDIKLTTIGGALGFILAVLTKDLLGNAFLYTALIIVALDVVRATYVKIKKNGHKKNINRP